VRREYAYAGVFIVALVVLLSLALRSASGWQTALCYLLGAACSLLAGWAGIAIASRAGSRAAAGIEPAAPAAAEADGEEGDDEGSGEGPEARVAGTGIAGAMKVAFGSGAVVGLTTASLSLLGLTACYLVFEVGLGLWNSSAIVLGFALGASTMAMFAAMGGGVFSGGAEAGGISEGSLEGAQFENGITDCVGDSAGKVAGGAADLGESFVAAIIAPVVIASSGLVFQKLGAKAMVLPLAVAAAGIACSVIGVLVALSWSPHRRARNPLGNSLFVTAVLSVIASFFLVWGIATWKNIGLFYPLLMGIVAGVVIALNTEYFSSERHLPAREIARSIDSTTGAGVVRGLGAGMMSVAVPVIVLGVAVGMSFWTARRALGSGGGVFGIGLMALGLLAGVGTLVMLSAYAPIVDSAQAVAELAPPEQEEPAGVAGELAETGMKTVAAGKGFASGAAALAALALFAAYLSASGLPKVEILGDYRFLVALLAGATVPFLFCGAALNAVGRVASSLVEEVRWQLRDAQDREQEAGPDYRRTVDITARSAMYEIVIPIIAVVVMPILIGRFAGKQPLAGFLAGAILVGFLLSLVSINTSGSLTSAGRLAGKEDAPPAESARTTGIAGPLRDVAAPTMNVLIKVMVVVALVFVPLFAK
jgi:K(+)-stimulated pyrophosphate-energized sodium pump